MTEKNEIEKDSKDHKITFSIYYNINIPINSFNL